MKSKKIFPDINSFRLAVQDEKKHFVYARGNPPQIQAINEQFSSLTGHKFSLALSSGTAAMATVFLSLLKTGDHIIINSPSYSWTTHFVNETLSRLGIESTWVTGDIDQESSATLLKKKPKIIYFELPTYFNFATPAFLEFVREARAQSVICILDNTYAGPCNFKYEHEFDIVIYSATKMIVGNGADLAGFICTNSVELYGVIFKEGLMSIGAIMSERTAQAAALGVATYHQRAQEVAIQTEHFLTTLVSLPGIRKIYSPWVTAVGGKLKYAPHPWFKFPVGLLSVEFSIESVEEIEKICNRFKHFKLAVSYGAPEALAMPACVFQRPGHDHSFPIGMVRLSLGQQESHLLIADLIQAMEPA